MPIFRRKDRAEDDPRPAIAAFYLWWAEHRDEALAAATQESKDQLVELLSPAIDAMHPDLDWELGHDHGAYQFVVSGGGNAGLRAIAERWRVAAPADDQVTYASSRPRDPEALENASLTVDDFEFPLHEVVAGTRVDPEHGRLDVTVHHPLFPLIDHDGRLQVAFIALDAALGEDDVERWLGAVEVAADTPIDAIPLALLESVVDQLRPGDDSGWVVLSGSSPQGDVVAMVRRPFARVDRPLCDTHIAVALTGQVDSKAVEALEAEVLTLLGGEGPHAVLIGHVITPRQSTIHIYVDALEVDGQAARPALDGWPHGRTALQVSTDPAWREIGHLLA